MGSKGFLLRYTNELMPYSSVSGICSSFLLNQNKICFLLGLRVRATQHNTGLMLGRADHKNPYILALVFSFSTFTWLKSGQPISGIVSL